MRHKVSGSKLGRNHQQRKSLLNNLMQDIILHGHVRTTEAKAKAVKPKLERLLTVPMRMDERNAIRTLSKVLTQKKASIKLMGEIKEKIGSRKSGLVRIRKVGLRKGDAAKLVQIEII